MSSNPNFIKGSELDTKLSGESDDMFLILDKVGDGYTSKKLSLDEIARYVQSVTIAPQIQASGSTNINSINTDEVTSKSDAARFLRNTTFGPTLQEIDYLVSVGSKRQWILEQISSSFDNSEYSEWDDTGEVLKIKSGWFGKIALSLQYPVDWWDGGNFRWYHPGRETINRSLLTSFIRNNPVVGGVGSLSTDSTFKDHRKSLMCKVVWVLNKLIPVSTLGGGFASTSAAWDIINWYNMLSRHAFTTYESLLEEVTYNFSMAQMLTHIRNQKSDGSGRQPDENYAREIMQLFTIGLYRLNVDGTYELDDDGNRIANYDNDDILELSKVFTGLTRWDRPDTEYYIDTAGVDRAMRGGGDFLLTISGFSFLQEDTIYGIRKPAKYIEKGKTYRIYSLDSSTDFTSFGAGSIPTIGMVFTAIKSGDDFSGTGEVEEQRYYPPGVNPRLKHYYPWYETGAKNLPNVGISIPENTDPETNIRLAIKGLVNHPSCAPNICKNLIKLAVTSNPSPDYVARVVSVFRNNGKGVVGDMASVWLAIFTDPEANSTINSSTEKGRIRDGFECFCNLYRSLDAVSTITPDVNDPNNDTNTTRDVFFNGVYQNSNFSGIIEESNLFGVLGTWPYMSPSVFSYYSLDYSISPALEWNIVVPELGSLPANTLINAFNFLQNEITLRDPIDYRTITNGSNIFPANTIYYRSFDDSLGDLVNTNDLVDKLNLILCGGTLSTKKKSLLIDLLNTAPTATQDNKDNRVCMALQLIIRSPEFWIS